MWTGLAQAQVCSVTMLLHLRASVGLQQYSGTQVHQLGERQQKTMTQEQTHPEFLVMEEPREKRPWRNLADA